MSVELTKAAADHVLSHSKYLRVTVKSGGCSGLRCFFALENCVKQTDNLFLWYGATIIIDPLSLIFIDGATIDYQEDMITSRFVLSHPAAKNACGCGESFLPA